jgi:hypothetical protein
MQTRPQHAPPSGTCTCSAGTLQPHPPHQGIMHPQDRPLSGPHPSLGWNMHPGTTSSSVKDKLSRQCLPALSYMMLCRSHWQEEVGTLESTRI